MRRYFTRALALSLAFTLALALLPGAALAAPATKVYVGDTEVSAGGYWKDDGAGGLAPGDANDYTVAYATATAGNAILTLKDAQITGAHHEGKEKCGVYADGDLTLRLLGDSAVGGSTLDNPGNLTSGIGVLVRGELAITGPGSLVSTGGEAYGSYGVWAWDLHMRGGTLMAIGGAADAYSGGVVAAVNDITMEGGRLTGTGGKAGKLSYGVTASMGITMDGGRLTGTGGPAGEESYGVNAGGLNTTVLGGEVTAQSLGAGPIAQAFDKAPAIDPAYTDAWVWYGADEEAAWYRGPQAPDEIKGHYTERYAYIGVDGPAAPPPPPPTPAPVAAAGPNYRYRTLRDGATGIEVSGYFSEDAALSVKEATLHPAGACAACDAIRVRQEAGELILLWDVSLATGGYSGGFEMRFPVGAKYNGQAVTLLHCRNNMLESQSALVEKGVAAGMFGGFSPFAVAADGGAAGIPKTGDGPALWLGAALLLLAAGAYGLAGRKKA